MFSLVYETAVWQEPRKKKFCQSLAWRKTQQEKGLITPRSDDTEKQTKCV